MTLINAYWYISSNLGDNLTPWMANARGNTAVYCALDSPTPKILGPGSILSLSNGSTTAWGCGLGQPEQHIHPAGRFLAVRGPLSYARVIECGGTCPPIFGDPGLLLPEFYGDGSDWGGDSGGPVALIPHLCDQERALLAYAGHKDVLPVSILDPIESVIDKVCQSRAVVSSSLHGLVLAMAYHRPFCWVRFSDAVVGTPFKFWDLFLGAGMAAPPRCFDLRPSELPPLSELVKQASRAPEFDRRPLLECCPF